MKNTDKFNSYTHFTLVFEQSFFKWAKSERKGSAERALKLMREMPNSGVLPGMSFFSSCNFFFCVAIILSTNMPP